MRIYLMRVTSIVVLAISLCSLAFSCEINRKIRFAGSDWDSAQFNVEVARYIVEKGYDCHTESLYGSAIPLMQGMVDGKLDINMEVWTENNQAMWQQVLKTGKVIETKGVSITQASQHFYIPKFVTQGDKAKGLEPIAPQLKSVSDMSKYFSLFKPTVDASKGRFYNCLQGWTCHDTNSKKIVAYGLSADYSDYTISSIDELRTNVMQALSEGKPIFFYYWTPSVLMAKHGKQLQALQEPAFNQAKWDALTESKTGEGMTAVAYPNMKITIAVSKPFADQAPELLAFLNKYTMPTKHVNEGILYLNDNIDKTGRDAAINFLTKHPNVWKAWLPADVAAKVVKSLPTN